MQLIIAARRGRRVLHLVNLRQQAAGLSTYPRNVGRLTSIVNSGATARQNGYGLNTVKQCGAAFSRKSFATASTSATDDSTPKRRGRPAKSNTTKTTKPKTRKSGTKKKAKKAKPARVLTEAELEKKRELREAKKVKETIKELVAMSLKKEEPKLKSALPWNLFVSEKLKGANSFGQDNALTNIAVEYRNLPESEREALNREASRLSEANKREMTEWVQSYTPLRIKEANLARKSLPKYMEKHGRKTLIKLSPIPDDRQVKRPVSAFLWFCKERIASGEYEGLSFEEMTDRNRIAWENSTESEKQIYYNKAEEDRNRYITEYRDAYGEDPAFLSKKSRNQEQASA